MVLSVLFVGTRGIRVQGVSGYKGYQGTRGIRVQGVSGYKGYQGTRGIRVRYLGHHS